MILNFFKFIIGIGLIIGAVIVEVIWVGFLFGSVLGVVLVLVFAPHLFIMPWVIGSVAGFAFLGSIEGRPSTTQNITSRDDYSESVKREEKIAIQKEQDNARRENEQRLKRQEEALRNASKYSVDNSVEKPRKCLKCLKEFVGYADGQCPTCRSNLTVPI